MSSFSCCTRNFLAVKSRITQPAYLGGEMLEPIDRIVDAFPVDLFQLIAQRTPVGFAAADRLAEEGSAEPERAMMRGHARHAQCEELFRASAKDVGLDPMVVHTKSKGAKYSIVSHDGVHLLRAHLRWWRARPRPARFREEWAAVNKWMDSVQRDLWRADPPIQHSDQMCAMLITTAHRLNPRVPAWIGIGVPRADLSAWIVQQSLDDLIGCYGQRPHGPSDAPVTPPDQARPILRPLGGHSTNAQST